MKKIIERCKRICGNPDQHCFIENKNQIMCISDIIINKVFNIKEMLELAARGDQSDQLNKTIKLASDNIDELIDWVKFLQIAHGHQDLVSILTEDEKTPDTRHEKRYPLPAHYQQYIIMKIMGADDSVLLRIIDFSIHGVKFITPMPLDLDSIHEITLSTSQPPSVEVRFKVMIKHCQELDGEFVAGGKIEKIDNDTATDFFKKIYDLIIEMLVKKIEEQRKKS